MPVTKEKKRSASLQSMVGSKVIVLIFYRPVVHAFKCVPETKEKKQSAALQSMVGSKVIVLMFYRPVGHAFKYVCP